MFEVVIFPLVACVVVLSAISAALFRRVRAQSKQIASLIATPPKQESYELQEFLADILSRQGIVKVERISPVDVLVRSARGM